MMCLTPCWGRILCTSSLLALIAKQSYFTKEDTEAEDHEFFLKSHNG